MNKTIKIIFALLLVFSTYGIANAGYNPLRLKSGTLSPLKQKGGTVLCELDFSKCKGNRKPLEQYIVEDYEGDMETFHRYEPEMLEWFCDKWNKDIDGGPAYSTSEESDFKLKMVIKNLNMGPKSGQGGASISGYAEFYKIGESEPFAVIEILKMNGTLMGAPMPSYVGLKYCINDLAEYLCDLIHHYK